MVAIIWIISVVFAIWLGGFLALKGTYRRGYLEWPEPNVNGKLIQARYKLVRIPTKQEAGVIARNVDIFKKAMNKHTRDKNKEN